MEYNLMEQYWLWLSAIPGMSPRRFYALLNACGDARALWDDPSCAEKAADEKLLAAIRAARSEHFFYDVFARLEKAGITALPMISDRYPARLRSIVDAPPTLYVRGNPDLNDERLFAIVGTRAPSYDGKKAAREFSQVLAQNGVTIVSGLARGVDTCAHTGCLEGGGRTIAVLGSGLNQLYPPENEPLARRIIEQGGSIVSEMQPDDGPQKWSFPARNRIISGLTPGVLVVEGRKSSGALITAEDALEQSRDVFAVPGSIYSPLAEGPNRLIQNGAYPALSPWDILEAQRWGARPAATSRRKAAPEMSAEETQIYKCVQNESLSFEEIANLTKFSTPELNSHLTMLILRGIIVKTPGNCYRVS